MDEIRLAASEATSAAAIQQAIDALPATGGRVVLPALDLELDRGIELHSNVELVGQGRDTVLRKAPGRIYPLSGYHNYGMRDVPLLFTAGLVPGMTVAIRDDRHGGFFETFARITWVDGTWVGIDRGLHSDYDGSLNPVLVTAFPLVFGLGVTHVAVRSLTLDGNREAQPAGIGACRGSAVYFIGSQDLEFADIVEADYAGEGLGFQISSRVHVRDCHVARNAGNGFHPGAGSTGATFEACVSEDNADAGFFFCVRANHISVRSCRFSNNRGPGISVGTRDSDNLMEGCTIEGNAGPGILFRATPRPVAMHTCRVSRCEVRGNAHQEGPGQITVLGDAHALACVDNTITGDPGRETAGIFVAPQATAVWLHANRIEGCFPGVVADAASLVSEDPAAACGFETLRPEHARHLGITTD